MTTETGGFPRDFPDDAFWATRAPMPDAVADAAALRLWDAARLPGSPAGARILDVGCGRGEIARAFGRLGARVMGIDADPVRVREARRAREAADGDVTFAHADAAGAIPALTGGAYDLACCHYAGWGYGGAERLRATFVSVEAALGTGRPLVAETYDGRRVLDAFKPELTYGIANASGAARTVLCRGTLTAPDSPLGIGRVDQRWEFGDAAPAHAVAFEPMTAEALGTIAACAGFNSPQVRPAPPLAQATPGAGRLLLRFTRGMPAPRRGRLYGRLHAALSARGDDAAIRDGATLSGRDCLDFVARAEAMLRSLPRGPGVRLVALLLPRSWAFPLGLMAARAAGYAFLPLDPDAPDERLRGILARARPDALVTLSGAAGRAASLVPGDAPRRGGGTVLAPGPGFEDVRVLPIPGGRPIRFEASHLVFTSGSSGRPKGVILREDGLLDTVDAQVALLPKGPGSSLWLLNPSFDASLSDILCPLLGGRVLDVHRPAPTRIGDLRAALARGGVADLPPSLLGALGPSLGGLDAVVFGGERCRDEDARAVAAATRGLQAYGPTEASVCVMMAEAVADWVPGLLGKPLVPGSVSLVAEGGRRYRVESADGPNAVRLVPSPGEDAVEGEIVVTGGQVAFGYLDDPEREAERFGELGGRRAHMTGDLARYANGRLTWVGRGDRQVKRNGRMVCPEEVEALAEEIVPGLSACCIPRDGGLVLALAGRGEVPADLAATIAARLGGAFRPSRVVRLDGFPVMATGKLDLEGIARAVESGHA